MFHPRRRAWLLLLPIELICSILHYLPVPDLLRCTQASKYLSNIVSASSSLQYIIELHARKFLSISPLSKGPSAAKRLQHLRDREDAWKSFRWKGMHSLKLPSTGSVYEFVGGYYGNGKDDDRRVTGSLSFFQLPSYRDDVGEMRSWSHRLPDVLIIDFTIDPVQDLMILVALAPQDSKYIYEIHLRTLSTNEPHPNANASVFGSVSRHLVDSATLSEFNTSIRIQVSGNIVALLIKEVVDRVGAHIEIWNWTVGPKHSAQLSRSPGIDDFTLLTHDSFLLVRPSGMLEVLTFEDPAKISSTPETQAIYKLPKLSEGYVFWYASFSSPPSAGYGTSGKHGCSCSHVPSGYNAFDDAELSFSSRSSSSSPSSFMSSSPPSPTITKDAISESTATVLSDMPCTHCPSYYPLPEDRVHACCVYVINPHSMEAPEVDQVHSFVFFVNIRTFMIHSPMNKFQPTPSSLPRSTSSSTTTSPLVRRSSSEPPLSIQPSPQLQQQSQTSAPTHHCIPIQIPWEEWGPKNTRWFRERVSTDWQHALYGHRTVETITLTKEEATREMARRRKRRVHKMDLDLNENEGESPAPYGSSSSASSATTASSALDAFLFSSVSDDAELSDIEFEFTTAEDDLDGNDAGDDLTPLSPLKPGFKRLRIRDFNPYVAREHLEDLDSRRKPDGLISTASASSSSARKGKGRESSLNLAIDCPDKGSKASSLSPMMDHDPTRFEGRLITTPSTIITKGVFEKDIVSSLPYREIVSREIFNVTDVMLDESRILLLRRALSGQLQGIDVLMM